MVKKWKRSGTKRAKNIVYYEKSLDVPDFGQVKFLLDTNSIKRVPTYIETLTEDRLLKSIPSDADYNQFDKDPVVMFYYAAIRGEEELTAKEIELDRNELIKELDEARLSGEINQEEYDFELREFDEDASYDKKNELEIRSLALQQASIYYEAELNKVRGIALLVATLEPNFKVITENGFNRIVLADHLSPVRLTNDNFVDEVADQARAETNKYPYPKANRHNVIEQRAAYLMLFTRNNRKGIEDTLTEVMKAYATVGEEVSRDGETSETDEIGFQSERLAEDLA